MSALPPHPDHVTVPAAFLDSQATNGANYRAWAARLPDLIPAALRRWELRPDGPPRYGVCALVIPVRRVDGTPAALKLQPVDDQTAGEPVALRLWEGDGAVRLLDDDSAGSMLLERLDATRPLSSLADPSATVPLRAELLARLTAHAAPTGVRRLADIAAGMLAQVPDALPSLRDPAERRLLRTCADAVAELAGEAGDRLLHWDLHHNNVLASLPGSGREPWLAIDPKPLAGDLGFELLPILQLEWDTVPASEAREIVAGRFDLLTGALDLERARALGWTLGRVLQDGLWDIEGGATRLDTLNDLVARTLLERYG